METKEYLGHNDLIKKNSKELIMWVDNTDQEDTEAAKWILGNRLGQVNKVSLDYLNSMYRSDYYSAWFKELVKKEIDRRKRITDEFNALNNKRAEYVKNKRRNSLLDSHPFESAFKIKFQYKEPLDNGMFWLQKAHSKDYPEERLYFVGAQRDLLLTMLKDKGDFKYELFDKGGIRPQGFNGFVYSMKTFDRLVKDDKIGWFSIYLNNILEPHRSGEMYSMEIFTWGEFQQDRHVS